MAGGRLQKFSKISSEVKRRNGKKRQCYINEFFREFLPNFQNLAVGERRWSARVWNQWIDALERVSEAAVSKIWRVSIPLSEALLRA